MAVMRHLLLSLLLLLGAARAEDEEKKEDVGTVVGIDLGTTYSWCVGSRAGTGDGRGGVGGSSRAQGGAGGVGGRSVGPLGP